MENITQACIYVGTYKKYNEGSLFGKWLNLLDYPNKDEFYEACRELHKDETDPEFMFQDWELIPSDFIGESWISENIFEIIQAVANLSESEQEAFYIWLSYTSSSIDDVESLMADFLCEYQGKYETEEDFAYELIEDCYELPEFAKTYFDYKLFAENLFRFDYWFGNGFVFSNC